MKHINYSFGNTFSFGLATAPPLRLFFSIVEEALELMDAESESRNNEIYNLITISSSSLSTLLFLCSKDQYLYFEKNSSYYCLSRNNH